MTAKLVTGKVEDAHLLQLQWRFDLWNVFLEIALQGRLVDGLPYFASHLEQIRGGRCDKP